MKINIDEDYEEFILIHRILVLEEKISKDASSAYAYASRIICCRWPIGEKAIANCDIYRRAYRRSFKIKLK